jgi:hypothetical protein
MSLRITIGLVLGALLAGVPSACSAVSLHHEVFAAKDSRPDADPITGEWDVTFQVQNSKTPATFKLKLDGDKVTGTVYSEHTGAGTLRDGSWKDNKLSFTLDFAKHESIAITGTLKDGMLVGEFRTEGFVEKWEAKRK